MKERRMHIAVTALCRATAAMSVQKSVWIKSQSQERWDCDVTGFNEQISFRNVMLMLIWSNIKHLILIGNFSILQHEVAFQKI